MRSLLESIFGRTGRRDFAVRLWDGTTWPEPSDTQPRFTLVVRGPHALRHLLRAHDETIVGEAYLRDDIDIEGDVESAIDLADRLRALRLPVAHRIRIAAQVMAVPSENGATHGLRPARLRGVRHSGRRDRDAVRHHYDVPGDFYALWLDRRMVYTCAYFASPDEQLELAQLRKLDYVCRKLRLRPGERLLDIGCGWGALVVHAASAYGVDALGITLSEPQAELARARIRAAGLQDRARVEVRDYRDVAGAACFDKIASIGMFEHVGEEQAPGYFAQVWRLLRPRGAFLNHAVAGSLVPGAPSSSTFSQRYVFPDHHLIPIGIVLQMAERSGFEVRDVESLREHYTLTLRQWVRRMEAAHADAARIAGEATYRAWRLVVAGAAHRFATGSMNVYQTLLAKPSEGDSGMRLTRADLYASPAPSGPG